MAFTHDFLGGDALSGYIQDGHYFLCNKGHVCHEASKFLWSFSYWQGIAGFGGLFLLLGLSLLLLITRDIASAA